VNNHTRQLFNHLNYLINLITFEDKIKIQNVYLSFSKKENGDRPLHLRTQKSTNSFLNIPLRYSSLKAFFLHVSYYKTTRLTHVVGLEMNCFLKDFYCSISFGNEYMVYFYCCWCPSIHLVWLNFTWALTLLEFEVGGYDKMENFLKTIPKLTLFVFYCQGSECLSRRVRRVLLWSQIVRINSTNVAFTCTIHILFNFF